MIFFMVLLEALLQPDIADMNTANIMKMIFLSLHGILVNIIMVKNSE